MDSVSVAKTFKDTLSKKVIFCSISEAIQEHPELVKKYIGTVVPQKDNYYSNLNSAVFSDGSFCYIPKGDKYNGTFNIFINQAGTGQFERTLVIADDISIITMLNILKDVLLPQEMKTNYMLLL